MKKHQVRLCAEWQCRQAVAGDTLEITTWLHQMRGSHAIRRYEIRKQNQDELLVTAEALWVWVEAKTMRPRPIPSALLVENYTE